MSNKKDRWQVHILGPDDVIDSLDEISALREANAVNIGIARARLKRPNDPNEPWAMAVVEKNGVDYQLHQEP